MSLAIHHPRDYSTDARQVSPACSLSAPALATGKTLLMRGVRMLLAVAAIAAVVTVAAGIKLAIWLPLYLG